MYMALFLAASSDIKCIDTNGLGYYQCYSSTNTCDAYYSTLPTFEYQFDTSSYKLPPAAYAFSFDDGDGSKACAIAIYNSPMTDKMILGEVFAIQYPIKYNYAHNTVGFAINTNAVEGV